MIIKRIIKVVSLLLVLSFLLFGWVHLYHFKYGDGISDIEIFYSQPKNSIDVMVFGSSHAFENVNTALLWKEYGIASFVLSGSIQPMWNTYYYMKEALKYQTPKVMVVDVYTAAMDSDYMDDSRIIKNVFGMKPSLDKYEAIKTSAPKELWNQYLFEYAAYHTRYNSLTESDYSKYGSEITNSSAWKGFGANFAVTPAPLSFIDISEIQDKSPLTPKNEKYLRKIITLAQKHNIPLVLIVSPYQLSEEYARRFNTISEIAADAKIPMLYCNKSDILHKIGLNLETDYADNEHMNRMGNTKYTRFLANYLAANYKIIDRRGDELYKSYDVMADDYEGKVENNKLTTCTDAAAYLSMTLNANYYVTVTIDGIVADPLLSAFKKTYQYDPVKNADYASHPVWVFDGKNIVAQSIDGAEYEFNYSMDHYTLSLTRKAASEPRDSDAVINHANAINAAKRAGVKYDESVEDVQPLVNKVVINATSYKQVNDGINFTIYDKVTHRLVESAGITNDMQIAR